MVKDLLVLVSALAAGCALIDAAGEEEPIFIPTECGWIACPCAYSGCEPSTDTCQSVGCRTCRDDSNCEAGDYCTLAGTCGACEGATFSAGDYYVGPSGTEYYCEYDPQVASPICLRTNCQ